MFGIVFLFFLEGSLGPRKKNYTLDLWSKIQLYIEEDLFLSLRAKLTT